jgi:hypothetical protein
MVEPGLTLGAVLLIGALPLALILVAIVAFVRSGGRSGVDRP